MQLKFALLLFNIFMADTRKNHLIDFILTNKIQKFSNNKVEGRSNTYTLDQNINLTPILYGPNPHSNTWFVHIGF